MANLAKILNLIKNQQNIAEELFLFSTFPEDVSLWIEPPRDQADYSNIKWLFVTYQQNHALIGINTLDDTIWSIDDEGEFHYACNTLQDLPYELLRLECAFTDNGTVKAYFLKEIGYEDTLRQYEIWCHENAIELDKEKIYHDMDGQLFEKSFDRLKY